MTKARLDADGTAKPKTRIVSHPKRDHCVGPGMKLRRPEYEAEDGTRTPLDDDPLDGPDSCCPLPWEVADGRGSLCEAVVLAAQVPGDPGRSIVAKGGRRTCEFIVKTANATMGSEMKAQQFAKKLREAKDGA